LLKGSEGRHARACHAARSRQGHGRLPAVREGYPCRASRGRGRHQRARVQAMRRGDRRAGAQLMPAALKERYDKSVREELRKQFSYANVMQIPKVERIILNIGMGEAIGNAKAMDAAAGDLAAITGQRPIITKSRKAISNFRLRIGMPIGLKVTLRGERMWHFLEKLITVALPRI